MPRRRRVLVATLLATYALTASCSLSTKARAKKGKRGFEQTGIASWYGPGFHGRTTANGETYDMEAMTAAHKQLPFGAIVEVKNRDNGRTTRVRITDRGPFVRGRIIDLSKAAARELGMLDAGVAKVKIKVVDREARRRPSRSAAKRLYVVQAGAFGALARAQVQLEKVRRHFPAAEIKSDQGLHRVVLTGLAKGTAEAVVRRLQQDGIEAVVRTVRQ